MIGVPRVRRIVATPAPTYDVVWNGAHHGRDDDLLSGGVERQAKREAPAALAYERRPDLAREVIDLLAARGALEMVAIADALQTGINRVNGVLYQLRQAGRVEKFASGQRAAYGRAISCYQLVQDRGRPQPAAVDPPRRTIGAESEGIW